MAELILRRGRFECRVCSSTNLQSVLDLGNQPLPAEYGHLKKMSQEEFPLNLKIY